MSSMTIAETLLMELRQEAAPTRKMLENFPSEGFTYKPHEKSMLGGSLAYHVAEITTWGTLILTTSVLDFAAANGPEPQKPSTAEALVAFWDKGVAEFEEHLKHTSDEAIMQPWTMRNGETIYFTLPKAVVLRTWVLNHLIHHRAQLGVYLRMLNVPVPKTYGPTADNPDM